MPDQQRRVPQPATTTTSSSSSSSQDEQSTLGNQTINDIIAAQNNPTGQRELNPNKNGIVFMGLNGFAADESRKLNELNRGSGGAISALPKEKQDHIKRHGQEFDLTTAEGSASYAATLGLPNNKAIEVANFLLAAGSKSRDELAQFVRILSEAEMGERKIDRMVLSGHSIGSQIWGDDNGTVQMTQFEDLAKIFPSAMGQVDHLMFSACYSGGENRMMEHQNAFEGVESIWAYHGSSPGTWTGAMDHMGAWEKATEPGKDASGVDPELAKGFRKASKVSTWNATDGYQGDQPMSYQEIERQLQSQDSVFQEHFSGQTNVENSQAGPLRNYYNLLQRAASHPQIDSASRQIVIERINITIRLLYFSLICKHFQNHYGDTLRNDYEEAGIDLPNFENMTRDEVLRHLESVNGQLNGSESHRLLNQGLHQLNSSVIPTGWV